MSTIQVEEYTGLETEADAKAFAAFAEADGWTATIRQEADGTFTLRLERKVEASSNAGGMDVETLSAPTVSDATEAGPLLDFIAKFESGGNYNAYFRNSGNKNNPKLTSMKLDSVIEWQRKYTEENGSPSSAAGRYQFIRMTLASLISQLGLDGSSERFTQNIQDNLATKLLEDAGLQKFLNGSKSTIEFGNAVARIWAAMPVLSDLTTHDGRSIVAGQSYYAGDGLNSAHASVDEYTQALEAIKA